MTTYFLCVICKIVCCWWGCVDLVATHAYPNSKGMEGFLFCGHQSTPFKSISCGNDYAHHRLPTCLALILDFPNASLRLMLCIPFICIITRAGWSAQIAPHHKLVGIGGTSLFQADRHLAPTHMGLLIHVPANLQGWDGISDQEAPNSYCNGNSIVNLMMDVRMKQQPTTAWSCTENLNSILSETSKR